MCCARRNSEALALNERGINLERKLYRFVPVLLFCQLCLGRLSNNVVESFVFFSFSRSGDEVACTFSFITLGSDTALLSPLLFTLGSGVELLLFS